jgi:preprotein translocase subunit SecF
VPFEIIKPNTRIDFVGQAKYALVLSAVLLAASFVAWATVGLRLGLDFTGGVELQMHFTGGEPVDEGRIRGVLGPLQLPSLDVVRFGDADTREYLIRFQGESAGEKGEVVDQVRDPLAEQIGAVEVDRIEFVGPRVGHELRSKALQSLVIASVLLLIYIGFRFTPVFAPGAIVAQVHDVLLTAGLMTLLGREFDLTVLAALLAILGYSINDKIVVYDRIRENMGLHTTYDFPHLVNDSLNQTLSRTVLTGGTTIFASFALFFFGGPVIASFGLAMGIGIIVGTYSSLWIATPILLALHARYGKRTAAAKPTAKTKKPKPPRV